MLTIPQEGDAVGDLENLVKPVADVNDPDILRFQFVDHTKQSLGFARGEGGAGFVHDDDTGILRESLSDLDDLLLGDGEAVALGIDRDLHTDAIKQRLRPCLLAGAGNEADASRFLPKEDIFTGGQVRDEVELLINDPYAGGLRSLRGGDGGRLAVDLDRAFIRLVGAAENLDERAFARGQKHAHQDSRRRPPTG